MAFLKNVEARPRLTPLVERGSERERETEMKEKTRSMTTLLEWPIAVIGDRGGASVVRLIIG